MNTLNKIKTGTVKIILASLLVVAGWASVCPSVQAVCFGYPESTGCTVDGVADQPCVGTLADGNIIQGAADRFSSDPHCTNTTGPLAGTFTCVIRGLAGNDVIVARRGFGDSIICGGGGNDIIQGAAGSDILLGGSGSDVLVSGAGTNLLYGGPDNDTLLTGGVGGSPTIFAGAFNFNFGGAGTRDICQSGENGSNINVKCEILLP